MRGTAELALSKHSAASGEMWLLGASCLALKNSSNLSGKFPQVWVVLLDSSERRIARCRTRSFVSLHVRDLLCAGPLGVQGPVLQRWFALFTEFTGLYWVLRCSSHCSKHVTSRTIQVPRKPEKPASVAACHPPDPIRETGIESLWALYSDGWRAEKMVGLYPNRPS